MADVEPQAFPAGSANVGLSWMDPPTVATGATAGYPGTFTPSGSYPPAGLAGMAGLTATPNTAWPSPQYVRLADGSTAKWSGSAWVAA